MSDGSGRSFLASLPDPHTPHELLAECRNLRRWGSSSNEWIQQWPPAPSLSSGAVKRSLTVTEHREIKVGELAGPGPVCPAW